MAEFLNRGKEEGVDVLMPYSQSVLITLVVLFKQIQSNAMKMVQGRLTSFYSFSRETNWVSIFKYLIWNRFYTKSNEKNKLVINNLLRWLLTTEAILPRQSSYSILANIEFSPQVFDSTSKPCFSLIINLSRYNTYKADWRFSIIFPSGWAQTSTLLLDS